MPTFSIIVPVYNAEKTLHKCLDSIRAQVYTDFEVHMVENGSGDASRAICWEYAERDGRFLLHVCEENCGPSGARNIGLDHAQGVYIAFLDSDDYVEPEYLEVLYQAFQSADVVFMGYHQVSAEGVLLGDHIPSISPNTGYYETLVQLLQQDMFGYTWIKAFCREQLGMCRFLQDLNLLEDEVFACNVLTEPCRIAIVPKAIVNYVTGNAGSLMGRTHQDYCSKVDVAYQEWDRLLASYERRDEALKQMANAHVDRCMYYGFERDVRVKDFFGNLAGTNFFANVTTKSKFITAVRERNFGKLAQMRLFYRLKNKIAKLLKR